MAQRPSCRTCLKRDLMFQSMSLSLKHLLRKAVVGAGRVLPPPALTKAGNLVRELELDAWMRAHGLVIRNVVARREALFDLIVDEVGARPLLYLGFGIAKGPLIRYLSTRFTHPDTVLHGFDSFEGLPEAWTENRPRGMFSTGGAIPKIDDPRVKFFKGWFADTVPAYVPPEREIVIFNLDADLYSSTILVLRTLQHLVRPGTYLYFDEFASYGHEERAFREFVQESGLQFKVRGAVPGLMNILFQCVSTTP